jgi:Flp pilus assembly protein TadG
MLTKVSHRVRRGTTTVEFAITCPIAFFIIFATIIGGLGVFRYQEVAALAREGARWASVHGADYADDHNVSDPTAQDVYDTAIKPLVVGLDPAHLTYSVTWNKSNEPLRVENYYEEPFGNTVTVTVTYQWFPEMYLVGPYTLTSTSTAQMLY